MLYKLFILTVILCANIHFNVADSSPRSLLTAAPSDTDDNTLDDIAQSETDDTTDDNGDNEVATLDDNDADNDLDDNDADTTDDTDVDGTDLTDDTDDNDETDIDEGDDELSNFSTTDSSDDSLETTDDSDSSDDSLETTADDSSANTDSSSDDDDSDSIDDDTTADSGDENDADSEEEDECIGLTENDCDVLIDDDGDRECAFNSVTSDCYGIERREGKYGSGNFDDGYNAAKVKSTNDTAALNTIVACLGAIVGILIMVIAGGIWCVYSQDDGMKKIDFDHEKERVNTHDYMEDDDLDHVDVDEVMVDVVEDVSPNMTGTNNGDRDPMLV